MTIALRQKKTVDKYSRTDLYEVSRIGSIIQDNCGSSNCHAGKYDASNFNSVWTNRASIARRIQGVGNIMPTSGNWDTTEQKQQVLDWLQN